jgi:hypothetical protein
MLHQWVNFIGLLLDFAGAIILVVPDFNLLASKFKFGRLRNARDAIDRGGLVQEESGYDELRELIDDLDPVSAHGAFVPV